MHVTLCDVGPRDGLQNDAHLLEPAVRAELCDRLAGTGLPRIECGSFVNPEREVLRGHLGEQPGDAQPRERPWRVAAGRDEDRQCRQGSLDQSE